MVRVALLRPLRHGPQPQRPCRQHLPTPSSLDSGHGFRFLTRKAAGSSHDDGVKGTYRCDQGNVKMRSRERKDAIKGTERCDQGKVKMRNLPLIVAICVNPLSHCE